MSEKNLVELYTDGACSGNPGPGGYGAILKFNNIEKEISGGEELTTNNRMELTAVIEGLKCLKRSCIVHIYTDSKYVVDGITKGWAASWRANNWKKKDNKTALNTDLWDMLLNELSKHDYKFFWIKGHDGHSENERCDELAVKRSQEYIK